MPKPAYTLFAQSISQDRETNTLSVFHIFEKLQQRNLADGETLDPRDPNANTAFRGVVVSVWVKDPADFGRAFLYELALIPPGTDEEEVVIGTSEMKFSEDRSKPFERITIKLIGFPLATKTSGILWMESRIRAKTASEWITQRFPLAIDVVTDQPSAPTNSA